MFIFCSSLRALGATFIPSFFIICSLFTICPILFLRNYIIIITCSCSYTLYSTVYMLRYYYYIRVIIMYTCICIPVLVVMSSIVYLNHIVSSTLFFRFLQSSYRPAQSRNMDVFVILIMSFNVFVSTIITPTLWLLVLT